MRILKNDFDLKDLSEMTPVTPQYFDWVIESLPQKGDSSINFEPIGDYSNGPGRHEGPGGFKNEGGPDGWPGGNPPSPDEVWGTRYDDTIDDTAETDDTHYYGFAGDDDIQAGSGDDLMFGGLGGDILQGGGGNDTVVGGDGDDYVIGNSGNDELHAGHGIDYMAGMDGDDTIFLVDDGLQDSIQFDVGDDFDIVDNFELGVDKVFLDAGFGLGSFADVEAHLTYNVIGDQAMLDLGGGDMIIFTGLDGTLDAADFGM